MSREAHVRICDGVGGRFPHATRLLLWPASLRPIPYHNLWISFRLAGHNDPLGEEPDAFLDKGMLLTEI